MGGRSKGICSAGCLATYTPLAGGLAVRGMDANIIPTCRLDGNNCFLTLIARVRYSSIVWGMYSTCIMTSILIKIVKGGNWNIASHFNALYSPFDFYFCNGDKLLER